MDKALFRAYIKELVNEQIESSVERNVKKLLPELLDEAILEIKKSMISESTVNKKPTLDRNNLARMMGLERTGDTISANTGTMRTELPQPAYSTNPAVREAADAINKDYSDVMKKLGLS